MMRINTPASSANIGPGFDCLGIAFKVYNSFDVKIADETKLFHVEDRFNNSDNLFLQAYRKGCAFLNIEDHIHVDFQCDIPVTRGLGSSASFIVAGITAASILHQNALSEDQIFQLSCSMEGHPDNIAPCFYGGLTASLTARDNTFVTRKIPLDQNWKYTLLIPSFEVSTKQARNILPKEYSRNIASRNTANAILSIEALRNGDEALLKESTVDFFHEPYRRTLIKDFDKLKTICEEDTGGVVVISGSGPTCLLISKTDLSDLALNIIQSFPQSEWKIQRVDIAEKGTETIYEF